MIHPTVEYKDGAYWVVLPQESIGPYSKVEADDIRSHIEMFSLTYKGSFTSRLEYVESRDMALFMYDIRKEGGLWGSLVFGLKVKLVGIVLRSQGRGAAIAFAERHVPELLPKLLG